MTEANESSWSRARWAGVGVAAAMVCAGTAAVAPRVLSPTDAAPAAAASVQPRPEPDGQAGWPFPYETGTDRVIASRVNDDGASELERTTRTKVPSDMMHLVFCRLSERPEPGEPRVGAIVTINGRETTEGLACPYRGTYPPVHGSLLVQDLSDAFGKRYDVEPGEPFTIEMWLERVGERVEVPAASFGVALARCEELPDDGRSTVMGRPGCQSLAFPGPGTAVLSLL